MPLQHDATGLRIRQLRLAKGLTLEELTERMGGVVTKQSLSKYEKGDAFPRPRVLSALAKALEVKAADLFGEPEYKIVCLQYRTRAPMRRRAKERIEAELTTRLERRLELEDRLAPRKRATLPGIPSGPVDAEVAEQAAEALRQEWGLGMEPIQNLSEVLERNSIHIFELDGGIDFDGLAAIAQTQEGELRGVGIAENSDADGDRQRFNLAHELGHVVLGKLDSEFEEALANRFAGAVLMPRELVFSEVGLRRTEVTWDELLLLKQRWGASVQAILHRLVDLEVISRAHYEWWWRQIIDLGYKKVEPMRLPRESSTWERRQVLRAEAEGLMAHEQAAEYLADQVTPVATPRLDRKALSQLSAEDRQALLRSQAERLAAQYREAIDREWLDADLGD